MDYLVAGATGLAGSAVFRELKRRGASVVGISSKEIDLCNRIATFEIIKKLKPKIVIDAAAKVGGINANNSFPVEFLSRNIQIQTNLMDACHEYGVEKFIFLGSNCIYPVNSKQPIKEEYILTGPLEKTNSAYAVAKLAGIELVNSYKKQFGHNWFSIMPINLYGPNDNFDLESSHVFPALIRKFTDAVEINAKEVIIWGTGRPRREFLHVDDLARAIMICSEKFDLGGHINVGTGSDITIADLASKIAHASGFNGEIIWDNSKSDGTMRKLLDIEMISKLGWKPEITLDEGIRSTIDWYRENK